jgi:hypothetical protein
MSTCRYVVFPDARPTEQHAVVRQLALGQVDGADRGPTPDTDAAATMLDAASSLVGERSNQAGARRSPSTSSPRTWWTST